MTFSKARASGKEAEPSTPASRPPRPAPTTASSTSSSPAMCGSRARRTAGIRVKPVLLEVLEQVPRRRERCTLAACGSRREEDEQRMIEGKSLQRAELHRRARTQFVETGDIHGCLGQRTRGVVHQHTSRATAAPCEFRHSFIQAAFDPCMRYRRWATAPPARVDETGSVRPPCRDPAPRTTRQLRLPWRPGRPRRCRCHCGRSPQPCLGHDSRRPQGGGDGQRPASKIRRVRTCLVPASSRRRWPVGRPTPREVRMRHSA